ncbi:MAG: TetR/AcrR family transcriptional regulator [Actinomycetes bacterium]
MSPAATIDSDTARRLVLDAADRLFYERGVSGVTMADVRDTAGVSMRRMYALYPSKRDLVAGWLEDRHVRWMRWFAESVARHTADGADPLVDVFDALREWTSSPGYRGCAFLNVIADPAEIDATHRQIVAQHKRALVDHVTALVAQAHPTAPEWLPRAIAVLIDGAIVESVVFGSQAPVDDARQAALSLVAATS